MLVPRFVAVAGLVAKSWRAGSCRCETVRSHSGSHVRLSRMQSVSLLSDFMRSSCTAQLLHSAALAQRSSCTAQLLDSGAYPLSARVRRCAGAATGSCTSRNYRASWSRPATASPHSPHCLRPSVTRGAAWGWQGWERAWRGGHTACLPTLPTFCAPLFLQHPPFPRQSLGRVFTEPVCALLALQMCADATMLRLLWLLVLNNMVPGASGLVFAPALRSTDSPSLRARRRHKGVRVSRAPVPPQHRPSPVSLCGRASYRAHFAPLYGQAWRCKGATPKSLH